MTTRYIGPVVFHWEQREGIWRRKVRPVEQNIEHYYRWTQKHIKRHGMNSVVLHINDIADRVSRLETHLDVIKEQNPKIRVAPFVGRLTFWENYGAQTEEDYRNGIFTQHPPTDVNEMAAHLYKYAIEPIQRRGLKWIKYSGVPVLMLIGNMPGWAEWPLNFWREVGEQLGVEIFGSVGMARRYDLPAECNLFAHGWYVQATPPTVSIRPGFWQYLKPNELYLPRDKGAHFRAGLRRSLNDSRIRYVFIESWDEGVEGSIIAPSETDQSHTTKGPVEQHPEDKWGRGPRRYCKIVQSELERSNWLLRGTALPDFGGAGIF